MALVSTRQARSRRHAQRQRGGLLAVLVADVGRAGLLLLLLHAFVFNFSLVRGSSMQPNIHDGDRLLVDKLSYALRDIERFDVVILRCPKNPEVDYVKRVVGLPGDRIELLRGRLHVNGRPVPEPFHPILDSRSSGIWTVPSGEFFVLGDNRPVSSDSREGWFVDRELIRGRVLACFWPPSRLRAF